MNLVLLGVNHKSASLEVRERLAIGPERLAHAIQSMLAVPGVREGMILSTCNRVEFLAWQEGAEADLRGFIQNYFAVESASLRPHLYEYRAAEAVRHIFRVASSLDSLVVGEPQILGQVKESYTVARSLGAVNANLDPLLQRAFTVARKVRNQTNIGISSVSIASVAVELAKKIFGSLEDKTVLLMGAGKMGELAAKSLMHQGAARMLVCNRTDQRAEALVTRFQCAHSKEGTRKAGEEAPEIPVARAVPWAALHETAATADIVVSCTGAGAPIFQPRHAEMYAHKRRQRPMFFIDIAVPRDVDPEINRLEGMFVYNVDDLQAVAAANLASRVKEAEQAEQIVRQEVERYRARMQSLDGVPSILALQHGMEEMRRQELRRMAPRLASLTGEQMELVEQVTRALLSKLQHAPIQAIKRAARAGDREQMAAIQSLFDPTQPAAEETGSLGARPLRVEDK